MTVAAEDWTGGGEDRRSRGLDRRGRGLRSKFGAAVRSKSGAASWASEQPNHRRAPSDRGNCASGLSASAVRQSAERRIGARTTERWGNRALSRRAPRYCSTCG